MSTMRVVLAGCTLAVSLVCPAPAAADDRPVAVSYRPPVSAPVVDGFRPPASPYGAGNRGIDFATEPSTPVGAAAAGEVVFAGPVGGQLHVVVLHADGLRTSYSFLAGIAVRRGDRVEQGQPVGTAGERLHVGVRAGDTYLDPAALLFGGAPPTAHLVPDGGRRAGSPAEERRHLLEALAGVASTVDGWGDDAIRWAGGHVAAAGSDMVGWSGDELRSRWTQVLVAAHYAHQLNPVATAADLGGQLLQWWESQDGCTPADVPVPPRAGRRIAVLVGGFGSAGGDAGILGVDTAALGYAPADVAQLSYLGGRVPGVGGLEGVPSRDYSAADSQGDIRVAAEHLRDLLAAIRLAHPGVPVDVVAHSQGGLVARAALAGRAPGFDARLPPIGAVVTLGSPHQGADVATAIGGLGTTRIGQTALGMAAPVVGLDAASPAAAQLSETSSFIHDLRAEALPASVRFVSIAARGDLVVAAPRSLLDGAANVLLPLDGLTAHHDLPRSQEAAREIALALAGMGPTCRSPAAIALDGVVANRIGLVQDAMGMAAGYGAVRLDARAGVAPAPVRTPGPR